MTGAFLTLAALTVSSLLGGVLLWLRRNLTVVEVVGESMAPRLGPGDRVLVRRRSLECVRVGDVVVVEEPDEPGVWFGPPGVSASRGVWVIKRVAALPGDPVPGACREAPGVDPRRPVPPGHLLVLGDNPDYSVDSRYWGCVLEERLLGVMLRELAPSASARSTA